MKKLFLFLPFIVASELRARDLFCQDEAGNTIVVEARENPRNGATAFVHFKGQDADAAGWAFPKAVEGSFFSTKAFHLGGSFPPGAELTLVKRPVICGRGACDYGDEKISAKLELQDESFYLGCR